MPSLLGSNNAFVQACNAAASSGLTTSDLRMPSMRRKSGLTRLFATVNAYDASYDSIFQCLSVMRWKEIYYIESCNSSLNEENDIAKVRHCGLWIACAGTQSQFEP